MKENVTKILLIIILLLAFSLRVYNLDSNPPSLSWDEAAVGYNALSIANHGKDEYGKTFPLYFKSFGDDKHPVHVYLTALSTKLLGFSEFTTRLPSAIFGVFNVLLIYFLIKLLFDKQRLGLIAAFFLAISPYNIHFSRFNHEANFVLFFFMLGLLFFYQFIKKGKKLTPLAFLSFGICFITYHPAKILVPAMTLVIFLLYREKFISDKKGILISALILIFFGFLILKNPQLLGSARVQQTSFGQSKIESTLFYKYTKFEFLGRLNVVAEQYLSHFSPAFLFISGDKNPKLSSQTGQFYKLDLLFLIAGIIFLLLKKSRESIMLFTWVAVAPLPASLVEEAPHAARALFLMGSWQVISAIGFYSIINLIKIHKFKVILITLVLFILIFEFVSYLQYYYGEYKKRYAIEWQYGMKQIVEYVKENPQYNQVYMTDVRSQPYIFFLYYLRIPQPDFSAKVIYNNSESKSYNTASLFDRYSFGGWDPIESVPERGVLYIITPSQYDGLKYKPSFEIKKRVDYPNGAIAFFLISAK